MTIWINNPFDFLPGEGARLQRYGLLAQALMKAGHQVVWWSSDWNHIKKEKREEKCANAGMRECANKHAPRTSVYTMSERSFEASGAGARSGIPRWSGNLGGTPRQGEADPEIRLIKTLPYYKNIGLRRLLSHWLYARAWEREAQSASGNMARKQSSDTPMLACPDLIICSAPPLSTGWVMRRLCRRFGCAGVIDVMDVWPETFERVAPAWMLWPLRWMAKQVYLGADGISAVGDSYLEVVREVLKFEPPSLKLRRTGSSKVQTPRQGEADPGATPRQGEADPKPMYRCYHGIEIERSSLVHYCDSALVEEREKLKAKSEKLERENIEHSTLNIQHPPSRIRLRRTGRTGEGGEVLKLVYVGNMGKGYDLVTLVRAVAEMIDEGHAISLDLAGKGEQEEKLQALARTKRENIRFHGVVTGDALRALLENADAGVVPMFPKTYVAVPYKLADYVAAGLPVMSSLKGETEGLIKRYDAGWCYEAGDVISLKRVIQACAAERLTPKEQHRKKRARQMAEEHFDAGKIYPDFVTWLEFLANKR